MSAFPLRVLGPRPKMRRQRPKRLGIKARSWARQQIEDNFLDPSRRPNKRDMPARVLNPQAPCLAPRCSAARASNRSGRLLQQFHGESRDHQADEVPRLAAHSHNASVTRRRAASYRVGRAGHADATITLKTYLIGGDQTLSI